LESKNKPKNGTVARTSLLLKEKNKRGPNKKTKYRNFRGKSYRRAAKARCGFSKT
jgi:hypothetical protein